MADELVERLQAAITLSQTGRRAEAEAAFAAILPAMTDDPLARCLFGHYYADLQDDPGEELRWDLYSLEALHALSDASVRQLTPALSAVAFQASIYLNIADDYRTLNDREKAAEFAELADASCIHLADDGYGQMIRRGVRMLLQDLRAPG
jgi:hypothetical protein